ncbi:unnamed protein product [Lymnaea stagnalis]|uniref:Major facilitator superfamily (MFS) profile domain-containing protein n=1 Tax=Lymnaea stagnalis TaxID=6523 RepID=A0AAV2HWX9_LYMST
MEAVDKKFDKENSFKTKTWKEERVTATLCLSVFGAVLGSFQFGYNTGVINSPESSIKEFMNQTEVQRTGQGMSESKITNMFAIIVAIFAVGGCMGGILAGWWADTFGRKFGLLANTSIGIVGGALMYFSCLASSYEMIIVGRFVIGFNCGLYTGLTPLYLSEISTHKTRGALGVLHQLGVTIGIFISQIFGFFEVMGNADFWNLLLGLAVFPCVLQLIVLPFCPESPRYLLISKDKEENSKSALLRLRGMDMVDEYLDEMKEEARGQQQEEKVNILILLTRPVYRMPVIISIVMQLSQQFSGINGIFYYSASLFKEAGLDVSTATHATSGVGAVMVVMTFITIPLMDRAGRRTLHLIGLAGMCFFSILITVTLALREQVTWFNTSSIVVSLLYVVFFAIGPGSIPWLIVAELFSQGPRSAAMSLSVLINWVANFIVGYTFPHLQDALGNYTFLPFTGCLVLFWIFTFFYVPETKMKTFEEVKALWKKVEMEKSDRTPEPSSGRNNSPEQKC